MGMQTKLRHSFKVSSSLLKLSGDNFVLSLMSEAGRETLKQGGKEGASFILTLPAFRSPSGAQRQALSSQKSHKKLQVNSALTCFPWKHWLPFISEFTQGTKLL